jgi:hypothetical protein
MLPPAVSAFHLQVIHSIHRLRIAQNIVVAPGNVFGVRALDLGRILQHDAGQVARREGAENAFPKPLLTQVRQVSTMIDMGVAQHHGINLFRVEGEMAVPFDGLAPFPLKEAAFQQQTPAVNLQQVHRTCRGPRRAQETKLHGVQCASGHSQGKLLHATVRGSHSEGGFRRKERWRSSVRSRMR